MILPILGIFFIIYGLCSIIRGKIPFIKEYHGVKNIPLHSRIEGGASCSPASSFFCSPHSRWTKPRCPFWSVLQMISTLQKPFQLPHQFLRYLPLKRNHLNIPQSFRNMPQEACTSLKRPGREQFHPVMSGMHSESIPVSRSSPEFHDKQTYWNHFPKSVSWCRCRSRFRKPKASSSARSLHRR